MIIKSLKCMQCLVLTAIFFFASFTNAYAQGMFIPIEDGGTVDNSGGGGDRTGNWPRPQKFDKKNDLKFGQIKVLGTAQIVVPIDYISVSFTVANLKDKPELAQAENNKTIDFIIFKLTRDFNISKDQVFTQQVRIYPEYDYSNIDGKQQRTLIGYRASNDLVVNIFDITLYAKIVATLLESSIEQLNNISFVPSKDTKYRDELLSKAFADAKQKAQVLSQAAERSLGRAIYISETNTINRLAPAAMLIETSRAFDTNSGIIDTRNISIELEVRFALE